MRQRLLSLEPPPRSAPTITFVDGYIPALVATKPGQIQHFNSPCNVPPSLPLEVCGLIETPLCGVKLSDGKDSKESLSAAALVESPSPCATDAILNGTCTICSLSAISAGLCPVGTQELRYSLQNSAGIDAQPLIVRVSITRRLAAMTLNASYIIEMVSPSDVTLADVGARSISALSQPSSLSNEFLASLALLLTARASALTTNLCRSIVTAGAFDIRLKSPFSLVQLNTTHLKFDGSLSLLLTTESARDEKLVAGSMTIQTVLVECIGSILDDGSMQPAVLTALEQSTAALTTVSRQMTTLAQSRGTPMPGFRLHYLSLTWISIAYSACPRLDTKAIAMVGITSAMEATVQLMSLKFPSFSNLVGVRI